MSKDTGGPAFPRPAVFNAAQGLASIEQDGMTLRDYFAAKVLGAIWSNEAALGRLHASKKTGKNIAAVCYEMADAMLAERNKQ